MYWPPLIAGTKGIAGTGVKAALLGTAKRAGGKLQVTYNGHPLYFFKQDAKAGQTKGEGLSVFGGSGGRSRPQAPRSSTRRRELQPPPTTTDPGYGGYGP